ncbi:MAG: polysaccharide deacetylase family protein [Proteobacteria bacterium]|nr:polysaccharide deacetylase family protein [Pseudomonadota bacterium]MBU4037038.1 polysaccharide deacetylase family protein [Pseudomonadota bacterium]
MNKLLKKIILSGLPHGCICALANLINNIGEQFYLINTKSGCKTIKRRQRVFQVLTFHRVGNGTNRFFDVIPTDVFERIVQYLSKSYKIFTASEAWARTVTGNLPRNAIVITFDDGYRDNYTNAMPVLKKYKVSATLFLSTGPPDDSKLLWHDLMFNAFSETKVSEWRFMKKRYWLSNIQSAKLAVTTFAKYIKKLDETERDSAIYQLYRDLAIDPKENKNETTMLTWDEVKVMADNGIEIGSHTVNHPILSRLTYGQQFMEISGAIKRIEEKTGIRPKVFAYPNGRLEDFNNDTLSILKRCGIRSAFTTEVGNNSVDSDPFMLKRGAAWSHDPNKFVLQLALNRLIE